MSHSQAEPLFPAAAFDVVVMAASAGGILALEIVLAGLPAGFPAAVVVVQHLSPDFPSCLGEVLGRYTALPVAQARTGEVIQAGRVYVAPSGAHLLLEAGGRLALSQAEPVGLLRPCADLLFESAADVLTTRLLAVVLSGKGADGSRGSLAVRANGGLVIAQSEATSKFTSMPHAVVQSGAVNQVLPLDEIAPALVRLVQTGEWK